jgi:hypothetical protein
MAPWVLICPPPLLPWVAVVPVPHTRSLSRPLRVSFAMCPSLSMLPSVILSCSCGVRTTTPSPSLLNCSFATRPPMLLSHPENKIRISCVSTEPRDKVDRVLKIVMFAVSQVVNDTNPTFFYCGTPGHCEKGMFGIINPPTASSPSASVGSMMPAMMQNVS